MRAHISQNEAHRFRKRVNELEAAISRQRKIYGQEWFGGVNIANVHIGDADAACIRTARRLGHAVVVIDDGNTIRFQALPHPRDLV